MKNSIIYSGANQILTKDDPKLSVSLATSLLKNHHDVHQLVNAKETLYTVPNIGRKKISQIIPVIGTLSYRLPVNTSLTSQAIQRAPHLTIARSKSSIHRTSSAPLGETSQKNKNPINRRDSVFSLPVVV